MNATAAKVAYTRIVGDAIEKKVAVLQSEIDDVNVAIRRFLKTYMATDGAGHIVFKGPTDLDRVKLARQLRRMEDKRDSLIRQWHAAKAEYAAFRSRGKGENEQITP